MEHSRCSVILTIDSWLRAKVTALAGRGHESLKRPPYVPHQALPWTTVTSHTQKDRNSPSSPLMVPTQGPMGSFVEKYCRYFLRTTTLLLKHGNCSFPLRRARWHSNRTSLKTHSPHGHCMVQLAFGILIPKVLTERC